MKVAATPLPARRSGRAMARAFIGAKPAWLVPGRPTPGAPARRLTQMQSLLYNHGHLSPTSPQLFHGPTLL